MRHTFGLGDEARLLAMYGAELSAEHAVAIRSHLRKAGQAFRLLYPQESMLDHSHTTRWVAPWRDVQAEHCSPKFLAVRLQAVRKWFSWAFARGDLDDNALALTSPTHLIDGTEPELVLRYNLQRPIATYLAERGPHKATTRVQYACYLNAFNTFINRRLETGGQPEPLNKEALLAWLHGLRSRYTLLTSLVIARAVHRFLGFLHETGRISRHPLEEILGRHFPGQSRRQAFLAILDTPEGAPLPTPSAPARFVSVLGPHLDAFLELMHAMGRRYVCVEKILQHLDRFVANLPMIDVVLTREILRRWAASTSHLAPSTQASWLSAVRQFCRYMARTEPKTWIPDRSLDVARMPQPQPHVFTVGEVRELLAAAARLSSQRWPLMPRTFSTLYLVLYATGLRVSEALHLRIRDVNLDARTFFIAETKFFKSRWVPFSTSLADQLRAYLAARSATVAVVRPDDAFFISAHRRGMGYSRAARVFRSLLRETGLCTCTARHQGPRLHDLRRAFAVHCVLRWYKEGADVQAKLPLLATYLGHGNVLATHVYLHATADMLQEASRLFERSHGPLLNTPPEEDAHDV